jgi:hypothetical protein
MSEEHPAPATATDSDPRLAVALARAEWRLEMLQELAGMGVSLAREISQRFIEGPHRPEPRPDPSRAYATVSRAVRLTLILEARTEKQILAWRKGDLSSLHALEPEPFLAPRFDSPVKRRERVRDCVVAAIDREALDPREAEWMRGRVQRELIDPVDLHDSRLEGGLRGCVEAICGDLGLKPDWSRWSDHRGFDFEADLPPRRPAPVAAGDICHDRGHDPTPVALSTRSRPPPTAPTPSSVRAEGQDARRAAR